MLGYDSTASTCLVFLVPARGLIDTQLSSCQWLWLRCISEPLDQHRYWSQGNCDVTVVPLFPSMLVRLQTYLIMSIEERGTILSIQVLRFTKEHHQRNSKMTLTVNITKAKTNDQRPFSYYDQTAVTATSASWPWRVSWVLNDDEHEVMPEAHPRLCVK